MEVEGNLQHEAGSSASTSAPANAHQRSVSKSGGDGKASSAKSAGKDASKAGPKGKGQVGKAASANANEAKSKGKGKDKAGGSSAGGGKSAGSSTSAAKDSQAAASTPLGGTPLFALTRVARIMRADEDVEQLPKDSVRAMAVATEKFVQVLAEEAYLGAKAEKRKVVTYKDLSNLVHRSSFNFLDEVIPQPTSLNAALVKRAKHLEDVQAGKLSAGGAANAKVGSTGVDPAADLSSGSAFADQSALSSRNGGVGRLQVNGFGNSASNGHAQSEEEAPLTSSDDKMQE
ncbi:CCAAT-binding factor, subunit C (HAP5) [Ceraceosorus bombacis]|uniref:CCAAT-binding factor, subunit C (HAP5) n=1 Tax=Ceraceosorus bombacis TaxID=401625 RepID=A0A0N7LAD3_9BASI|nr:CCAAT-binding factor, subunit C (HAP5) [Ceraceosorus bombacis]